MEDYEKFLNVSHIIASRIAADVKEDTVEENNKENLLYAIESTVSSIWDNVEDRKEKIKLLIEKKDDLFDKIDGFEKDLKTLAEDIVSDKTCFEFDNKIENCIDYANIGKKMSQIKYLFKSVIDQIDELDEDWSVLSNLVETTTSIMAAFANESKSMNTDGIGGLIENQIKLLNTQYENIVKNSKNASSVSQVSELCGMCFEPIFTMFENVVSGDSSKKDMKEIFGNLDEEIKILNTFDSSENKEENKEGKQFDAIIKELKDMKNNKKENE